MPEASQAQWSPWSPERIRKLTHGDKPYSIGDLISCNDLGIDVGFDLNDVSLQQCNTIPISLKSTLVKPDPQIHSIIRTSQTLPRETPFLGDLKELKGFGMSTFVHGNVLVGDAACDKGSLYSIVHQTQSKKKLKLLGPGAAFILLVSSDAVAIDLSSSGFDDRFKCIIVSAQGHPDILIRMAKEFNLPVLAFLDMDPRSVEILALIGPRLDNLKWLGIRPSDFPSLSNRSSQFSSFIPDPMTEKDIKTAKILLTDSYIQSRPLWLEELRTMLVRKKKVPLEILCSPGFFYLRDLVLPIKLQTEDWI